MIAWVHAGRGADALSAALEGLPVVDSAGRGVGTVVDARMSGAAGITGCRMQVFGCGGSADWVGAFTGGPDLPDSRRERLMRLGYLRIDVPGVLAADLYITADQVGSVARGRVHLAVPAAALSLGR